MVNATSFKSEDNPTLESLAMTGDIDMGDNDIINLNVARFNLTPSLTPAEGDLYWNATDKTLNIKTDTETVIQIGQEQVLRSKNNTGVQVNNGEVVYISGADTARPEITLANSNSWETSQTTIGIATQDIANGSEGFITTFGLVRDLNTSGMIAGDIIYLDTTDGQYTTTRPTHPDFVVRIGYVINVDASDGIVFFSVDHDRNESFFNGTFNESFDALVTSNGTIVTMSLERTGGGNLTSRFSDGPSTLDTTPAATIALTAGTDAVPVFNYIYIPQSTKVLTKSTSSFPTATEHIKVGSFFVQSATRVQSHGVLVNQNHNDHGAGTDLMGHMSHTSERIRHEGALFTSGLGGAGVDDYLTLALSSSFFKSNAGTIYQMHRHIVPAFDQSTGDQILIVNDSVTAYLASSDLFTDITADSTGAAIGLNKYFNLTFIAIGNKTGEYSPILCNLPSGSYNTQAGAEQDTSGFDNFNIPEAFNIDSSTGLLICRLTIQMGTTWTYISTTDLRGRTPQTATAGGPGVALTTFDDASFDIHNATDPTKKFVFDATNIATAITRTITMPDTDVNLPDQDLLQASTPTFAALLLPGGDIGSATSEIGEVFIADNKKIKLGSAQRYELYTDAANMFIANAGTGQVTAKWDGNDDFIPHRNILARVAGTPSLGSAALEWGDVFIATNKKIKLGSVQRYEIYTDNSSLFFHNAVTGNTPMRSDANDDMNFHRNLIPVTASGSSLGTSTKEFSDFFQGDDKKHYQGAGQEAWTQWNNAGGYREVSGVQNFVSKVTLAESVHDYATGDYGAAWATVSLPGTPTNGQIAIRYNSNGGVLASRFYVYTNSAWTYVDLL